MKVCIQCFDDKSLQRRIKEIRPKYPDGPCDFHPRYKGIPVQAIVPIVDRVFRENYRLSIFNAQSGDFSGQELSEVLTALTCAQDEAVSRRLASLLVDEEDSWVSKGGAPFYQEDFGYERTDEAYHGLGSFWQTFCRGIVHQQRFFNDPAKALLAQIFEGIHLQRDARKQPAVFLLQPGMDDAIFLRARQANDPEVRKAIGRYPASQMGPPPQRLRTPGRMNPSGVAVFYGAFDLATCLAELRPRVGSVIASAKFTIARPLVVLDTTRFAERPKEQDLFAKDNLRRTSQWNFMQQFMHEIAKPISPNDEHLDYIPTQAVSEYLNRHHTFHLNGVERKIEAVIFRSAQHPTGKNIVILGDAAAVLAEDTSASKRPLHTAALDPLASVSLGQTEPTLRYLDNSLTWHQVEEAEFRPTPFSEG